MPLTELKARTMPRDALQSIREPRSCDGERDEAALTLDWANGWDRQSVIDLAAREGRQTMNLRTMSGAKLVVLRRPDGKFAGWTGMDVSTDPERPEVFSQFVYPEFRGAGLGTLLEHVWWAYLASHGCTTGYMRMELESNSVLFERRVKSGYCRQVSEQELGQHFVEACRKCELFGSACRQQVYLAVDVQGALAACTRSRGSLDIGALPMRIAVKPQRRAAARKLHEVRAA
jgi:GNAT superfamily N-acetyltransferase